MQNGLEQKVITLKFKTDKRLIEPCALQMPVLRHNFGRLSVHYFAFTTECYLHTLAVNVYIIERQVI